MQASNNSALDFSLQGQFLNFNTPSSQFLGLGSSVLGYNNQASVGMYPSINERNMNQYNQMLNAAYRSDLNLKDKRPQMVGNFLGTMLGGGRMGAQASMFLQQNPFFNQLASTALNSTGMSGVIGSSPADLGFGAFAATSTGMTVNGRTMFPATQRIRATELAEKLYENNYSEGGVAFTDSVKGYNTEKIGELLSIGAGSGAFRGMEMNDDSMKGIQKYVEDSAGVMRELQDVFGDKSFTELSDIAQKLTGASMGSKDSPKQMLQTVKRIKEQANYLGADVRDVIGQTMQVREMLQGYGFSENAAGKIVSTMDIRGYHDYVSGHQQRSGFGYTGRSHMSSEQYASIQGLSKAAMIQDKYGSQTVGLVAAMGSGILDSDPTNKKKIEDLLATGDDADIREASSLFRQTTGIDIREYVDRSGGAAKVYENLSVDEIKQLDSYTKNQLIRRNQQSVGNAFRKVQMTNQEANDVMELGSLIGMSNAEAVLRGDKKLEDIVGLDDESNTRASELVAGFAGNETIGSKFTLGMNQILSGADSSAYLAVGTGGRYAEKQEEAQKLAGMFNNMNFIEGGAVPYKDLKSFTAGILGDSTTSLDQKAMAIAMSKDNVLAEKSLDMKLFEDAVIATDAGEYEKIDEQVTKFVSGGVKLKVEGEERNVSLTNLHKAMEYMERDADGNYTFKDGIDSDLKNAILNEEMPELSNKRAGEFVRSGALADLANNEMFSKDFNLGTDGSMGSMALRLMERTGTHGYLQYMDEAKMMHNFSKDNSAFTLLQGNTDFKWSEDDNQGLLPESLKETVEAIQKSNPITKEFTKKAILERMGIDSTGMLKGDNWDKEAIVQDEEHWKYLQDQIKANPEESFDNNRRAAVDAMIEAKVIGNTKEERIAANDIMQRTFENQVISMENIEKMLNSDDPMINKMASMGSMGAKVHKHLSEIASSSGDDVDAELVAKAKELQEKAQTVRENNNWGNMPELSSLLKLFESMTTGDALNVNLKSRSD